jgi:ubiquitin-conjugating enzyme E2 Q
MCLNEIVNATDRFVSRSPHIVVAQLDWIQTRYLFVKCSDQRNDAIEEPKTDVGFLVQDPAYLARGDRGCFLRIPINAVLTSNRFRSQGNAGQGSAGQGSAGQVSAGQASDLSARIKRRRIAGTANAPTEDPDNLYAIIDDGASVDTEVEDMELFFSDNDELVPSAPKNKGKSKLVTNNTPQTDFLPSTLDHSSLPIISSPAYATTTATNAIQRELRAMLKLQGSQPLHELGWYIDPEHIGNIYQWIVELHSFDPVLPLSVDMKKMGVNSVVLEVRFGREFPMSPPFVRVIRPRFLSFAQRGGGHVTAGGALCMEVRSAQTTSWGQPRQYRVALT